MFDPQFPMVPSGVYLFPPIVCEYVEVTNPFYPDKRPLTHLTTETGQQADKLYHDIKGRDDTFVVHQSVIMDYASEMVRVVRMIKESNYEVVLCPLRGARLPAVLSNAMTDRANIFKLFDGTAMAQGHNDARILGRLREILFSSANRAAERRIGVLDTAKGGDSCRSLAKLLRGLNDEVQETWRVGFHLMHNYKMRPPRAAEAYAFRSSKFRIELHFHPVADLLIEDEPSLLGYEARKHEGVFASYPLQKSGQILLYRDGGASLFWGPHLDEMMFEIVGEEVSKKIEQDPDAALMDPERWKRHIQPSGDQGGEPEPTNG